MTITIYDEHRASQLDMLDLNDCYVNTLTYVNIIEL